MFPGDSYVKRFTTSDPSTGAARDADSLPVATAALSGSGTGAMALTVANVSTGLYEITGTVPAGRKSGDVLNVSVAATVNAVAGVAVVDTQMVVELVDALRPENVLRLLLAAAAGKTDGFVPGTTGTGHLRDTTDTKDRITATYDANGNRTAVTLDSTG